MKHLLAKIFSSFPAVAIAVFGFGVVNAIAQPEPVRPITPPPDRIERREERRDERAPTISDTMSRLQIERRAKEHRQMVDRSEEAMKLAAEIERSYDQNGRLGRDEISKLNEIEKLVRRVRSDLGAGDDKDESEIAELNSLSPGEIVKNLAETTSRLFEELKKTTRHSISAAAISTSNTALRVARFLKLAR